MARANKTATQIVAAECDFDAWQDQARKRTMGIASNHSGTLAEASALLMVSSIWPDSEEGRAAIEQLPQAALSTGISEWASAIEQFGMSNKDVDRFRPLVSQLVKRVEGEPDHPDAALLLCKAAGLITPNRYAEAAPEEFASIAEMICDRYASSQGIANFCEQVGGMGEAPAWGSSYEPHVREILIANQDRYVRCCAQLALASIVQSAGIERQEEARRLLETFLDEFKGDVAYPALAVEQNNRQTAERMLETIRTHGLGATAPATVGLDLEENPLALEDYRGKVVLLSFWATWCAPCMAAIEHERELVAQFDPDRFAIVGVNGDKDRTLALRAVAEHGISWRSFQNFREGATSIESDWHIGAWPTFYLLNSAGKIERRWEGLPPKRDLDSAIRDLIGQ